MIIKILGSATCKNCEKLARNVRLALDDLELEAEVIKVTNIEEILKYEVFVLPGLVVDEKLVSGGKVMRVKEIAEVLLASKAE